MKGEMQPLPSTEVLDILVTSRNDVKHLDQYYCVWEYQLWIRGRKRFIQLISEEDLQLYPGEHTQVAGNHIYRSANYAPWLLVINSVDEAGEFVIKRVQTVDLLNPQKGGAPNTSYAVWVETKVNGHSIKVGVPILAFGKIIEDWHQQPSVVVSRVDLPTYTRRSYMLYGQFPQ